MSEIINRAFMYGESVFTTMRMINGHLCDGDYHFERLKKSAEFVYGPFMEKNDWFLLLKNHLQESCKQETGDKIIRLTLYREQSRGLIGSSPISVHDLKISLHASNLDIGQFNDKRLKLRTCVSRIRPSWWPNYLKTGDYLETILSQKIHMKAGDDDVLFLSQNNTVLESSVANIFVVRDNILYTAPSGPNVFHGIMRDKVIKVAGNFFNGFQELEISLEQLYKADAIIGTNSVRGPFLIDQVDNYQIHYSEAFLTIFKKLRKSVFP